uniref:SCP domain-containing protein n=1 Tax=Erpetoichthys calabaricus TaxID=27687 RepID=A0A8C4RPS1_ERPCA
MCFLSPEILTTDPNVQKTIVDKHNAVRELVLPTAANMVKMGWSTEAAANAEKRANTCEMNHSLPKERTIKGNCGENVYMSPNAVPWDSAIQKWEDEIKDYAFGKDPQDVGKDAGHYTEVSFIYHSRVRRTESKKPFNPVIDTFI